MVNRKRALLIFGLGVLLIAITLFWPVETAEAGGDGDAPCLASKFGLPCRP
jgi:hypothetical protein